MCSHSISSPFPLLQRRLRSESMCGAESDIWKSILPTLNHLHFALFFILVCVSIILAHMLASLDCVSRQECWEPLLPKHLQRESVLSPQRRQPLKHWRVNQTTKKCPAHQRTKITWELINDMKASSTLINHMLPHDQQEWTRFLTPSINPNMTIFAFKDLPSENIYDECPCRPHVWKISSVFLAVKKSAWVSLWQRPRVSLRAATSNNPWVLTCLHVMKTFNKNWCWLTLWSKVHPSPQNQSAVTSNVTALINKQRSHPPCSSRNECHWLNIILFQGKMNWIGQRRVCFDINKG